MRWLGWFRNHLPATVNEPDEETDPYREHLLSEEENHVRVPLEFCRWLHNNFDVLIEEHRDGLIVQAHKDAAAEKAGRAEDKLERKGFGNQSMAAGASNKQCS